MIRLVTHSHFLLHGVSIPTTCIGPMHSNFYSVSLQKGWPAITMGTTGIMQVKAP